MEDADEHNVFEEPKRSMPPSQEEFMAPCTEIPVNRNRSPPETEAPLPANHAASGSQIPSILLTTINSTASGSQTAPIMLTFEALQFIIDSIAQNGGARPSAEDNMKNIQDFMSFSPPAFDGSSDDLAIVEDWIEELEAIFDCMQFQDDQRVRCAVFMLKGNARHWWTLVEQAPVEQAPVERVEDDAETHISWQEFKDMFLARYYPETVREEKEREFLNLRQGSMSVFEYERKFEDLSRFAPEFVDTQLKMARRFVMGLRNEIKGIVAVQRHTDYSSAVRCARILDEFTSVRSQQAGRDQGSSSGQKRKYQQVCRRP